MLHGHTGGGIGEIWRSAAMGLMQEKLPRHYREFMDARRWHYEMSRRFDGSFAILGGARYDNVNWGAGYALTYTIPRKTLQLSGAPRSKFAKSHPLPERPWGTPEDDAFQSIEYAVMPDGSKPDLSDETFAEHSGLHILPKLRGDVDPATIRRYMHHPDYVIRSAAAGEIRKHGTDLLKEFLASEDARVRRAALESLENDDGTLFTREIFDHLLKMLRDDNESWFVKELALSLLGKAPADWVVDEVDLILYYFDHPEWWLRNSALLATAPVIADERSYQRLIPAIGEMLETNHRFNVVRSLLWGDLPDILQKASPEVQQLARATFKQTYLQFEEMQHPSERVSQTVNEGHREAFASSITKLPGGYDTLYEIGRQRYPDEELPFKEVFLKADSAQFSPELRQVVNAAVGGNLIPEYIAKHSADLLVEARSEAEARGAKMPGLIDLYEQVGIDEYTWKNVAPESHEMKWWHHSFDPKEKFMESDDRLGRYREVTFPDGMEQWFAPDFDPAAKGWAQGLAPFGAADGKLERFDDMRFKLKDQGGCKLPFCGCHKPLNTLWENDVLMLHGQFEFPEFEEGYRYRLLHGGISHVGSGGGYRLYVNGKLLIEDPKGVDRRAGEQPEGRIIPAEMWDEFDGPVTLAAITFKKNHPRTKKFGGNISVFMQRQKVPPIEE